MKLATNEKVLKEWTYAKTKSGRERSESILTVTNKRIICNEVDKKGISRQEIPIDSVKSLTFEREKGTGWFLIILGVLTLVFLIGVFLIIRGIQKLLSGSFSFVISTYGEEGTPLEIGVAAVQKKGILSRIFGKTAKKMRIRINNSAAEEIIESLGAIIIEYRAA